MICLETLMYKFLKPVLIFNTLAVLLFFNSVPAQNNTLSVARPQQNNQIKITVERNRVQIGELIEFHLKPDSLAKIFEFGINFGDGTNGVKKRGQKPSILHGFSSPGLYTVSVFTYSDERIYILDSINIKVDSVFLEVNPSIVFVSHDINIKTGFNNVYGVVYRFFYDNDLSLNEWTNNPQFNHKFLKAGVYNIYAKIGQRMATGVSVITSSVKKQVTVLPVEVYLTADKYSVEVNDPVSFFVRTNPINSNFKYLFDFDDGTGELSSNSTVRHSFSTVRNYNVNVQLVYNDERISEIVKVEIKVAAAPPPPTDLSEAESVELYADNNNILSGSPIILSAIVKNRREGLNFWFYTGDGNQPRNTINDTIHYNYLQPGNYYPYVQVLLNGQLLAESEPINITVGLIGPDNGIPIWIFIIGGIVVLAVGIKIKTKPEDSKWWFPFKSSFQVYPGSGSSRLTNEKKFNINFEFRLNPNFSENKYKLNVKNAKIIKSIRRGK